MLEGLYVYDADAHVMMSPRMWADLPAHLEPRRPRAIRVDDADGLGAWKSTWLCDGRITPHLWGPGSQPANTPATTDAAFPGTDSSLPLDLGSRDLSAPEARLRDLDQMGIDTSVMYPSTLYATLSSDAELEAGLYRSFNRYMGAACRADVRRLKWAGLLPLRDPRDGCEAVCEMKALGASAAVVFGTVGDRLLSDPLFTPVFDELERAGLPLSIHFGMSYPAFQQHATSMFAGQLIGMTYPLFLAFYAVIAGGLLDRHPALRVAFLEFGSEWLLYVVPRSEIFRQMALRRGQPRPVDLPQHSVRDYVRSGRFFVTCEGEDDVLAEEIARFGVEPFMYASDIPHPEMRENAALEILERQDLTDEQKRRILCDNAVRFYGPA
jgi:uncharacterized protein